jgi:16S rRNA (adenine1518-N6/adenine1519-N6)-dimethyltransferase
MRAKKSLGQNFLKSKTIVSDILNTAKITSNDTVLEIGPGKGVLTKELLKKASSVIAIEKDSELIKYLNDIFSDEIKDGKLTLIHNDILKVNLSHLNLYSHSYKLVANIPYYITGQIFKMFLESNTPPSKIVLMAQKEVAERIVARDKKESILSISVKIYGQPKLIKKVPARYFSPKPKVDSAILLIDNISTPFKNEGDKKHFFKTLKAGFAHKRKLLKSNLECKIEILEKCNIEENARAEDLAIDNWMCLNKNI